MDPTRIRSVDIMLDNLDSTSARLGQVDIENVLPMDEQIACSKRDEGMEQEKTSNIKSTAKPDPERDETPTSRMTQAVWSILIHT